MKMHPVVHIFWVIILLAVLLCAEQGNPVFAQVPVTPGSQIGIPQGPSRGLPGKNQLTAGWEWVEGSVWYTYVTDWIGTPLVTGYGTYVGYYQNADISFPYPDAVYYLKVTVYGISSPQAGTMSAYITFFLPPSTSLAISAGTPMFCYGGEQWQQFTCDFTLQQVVPGQYLIPSGEYGNVWPVAAGAGWEFQIPVRTSTTLNNSNFLAEITNIDGYQNPPKLYPYVPIYVWPGSNSAPGAFNKYLPVNGATGISTNPELSWYVSEGATTYEYCLHTSTSCTNWKDYSIGVIGLTPGTLYYWQVRAVNGYGTTYADGSASAYWSFTTGAAQTLPGAFNKSSPGNGAAGVSTNPTLSWSGSSGVGHYEYCYYTSPQTSCSTWFQNGSNTSAALSGLTGAATYYWHVRAVNNAGTTYSNGSASAYWSFTTSASGNAPGAFGKSSPGDGEVIYSTSVSLYWGSSSGAVSYFYCYDTSNDDACSIWVDNGASTSKTLNGLSLDTTYYWHVKAQNANGITYSNGLSSAFWSFRTKRTRVYLPLVAKPIPPTPTPVLYPISNNGGESNYTVSWSSSEGASNYELYEDVNADFMHPFLVYSGLPTHEHFTGKPLGTYFYRVRASGVGGYSQYSNIESVWVRPKSGQWSGTTSQGNPIVFQVQDSPQLQIAAGSLSITFDAPWPLPPHFVKTFPNSYTITNFQFTTGSYLFTTVSGEFLTPTTASGSFSDGSKDPVSGTWTASWNP